MCENERTIFIGDIHGCYEQFIKLIVKLEITKDDTLILLGDYTDRGPKAYKVVQRIKSLKKKMGNKLILLYGNHEDMLMYSENVWLNMRNGGIETLLDFEKNGGDLDEYREFIKINTVIYWESEKVNAVHAGTVCEKMENCNKHDLKWDRMPYLCRLYSKKLTVIGHTPIDEPTLSCAEEVFHVSYEYETWYKLPEKGLLNIDTNCVAGGALTAMIVSENKMIFKRVQ